MAVQNASQFKVTQHAEEQIKKRFGLEKSEISTWLLRFLNRCNFVKTQDNNREVYRKDDIVAILDMKQKKVITMYTNAEQEISLNKKQANPEVRTFMLHTVDDFISKKRKDMYTGIVATDKELRKSMKAFKAKQSEENLELLRASLSEVVAIISHFDELTAEARAFIE